MRPPTYCGVSGVTTPAQATAILAAWPADAPAHSLMLGLLASQKTIDGGERNARSAAPEDIADVFNICDQRALCLVHYYTKDPTTLCEQLIRANGAGGERCDGVQINVPWPPVDQLETFSQWVPRGTRVVLQVGTRALADIQREYSVRNHAMWPYLALKPYHGLITDVLIDGSGGRGLPIDLDFSRTVVAAIRHSFPDLGITIAGGLCAEALPSVAPLVRQYGLSLDAEGRLRDEHDELDLDKARAWLRAAAPLVCGGDRK